MIQLKVGNKLYSGWENISITKDMLSIAHTFQLSIEKGSSVGISEGDFVQILDDNKFIVSGYIDIYDIEIQDSKSPLILTGRSKACDLVDCMVENFKKYTNLNALKILQDIIVDFDISVSTTLSLDPVDVFETKVGETFFNAINRLCKQTNLLPISDSKGNLVLIKNQNKAIIRTLKDQDLKKIKFVSNNTNQFSKYSYKKEAIVVDVTDAHVDNKNIKRYRPFVGTNGENKTNLDMSNWKKDNAEANGIQLDITVDNWDYDINTIIGIDSQLIKNSYLIKSISFIKGNNGKVSNLVLVDKRLFNV